MSQRPLLIGNWKMNGSVESSSDLVKALVEGSGGVKCELVVCPPLVHLGHMGSLLNEAIQLGAQDVSAHGNGAYTGDVSASMLEEMACRFVIVGHSERRQYHQETDGLVAEKTKAVLAAGMTPVICVGETLSQRESDQAWSVVSAQMQSVIDGVDRSQISDLVWAYEPVWAIGTGRSAQPDDAQDMHHRMREFLSNVDGADVPLLYGGSVNGDNAAALFACQDIDGGLVGGASLKAGVFLAIAQHLSVV